jgi:hypothetical protein
MRRFLFALAGLAAAVATVPAQEGTIPRDYFITPEVGAWTICAASFSGETSIKMACDLVTELRNQYRLKAYLFNRGDQERRQQAQEIEQKRKLQALYLRNAGLDPTDIHLPVRRHRIIDQYVVLIGGYSDMRSARHELDRIKKLQPPRSVPHDTIVRATLDPAAAPDKKEQQEAVNPFANSFVSPNPTVPVNHEQANKPDPFLKELNAYESYSLLNCPKPWTLLVKEFRGATMLQSQNAPTGFLEKLFGQKTGEQLNACGVNAHNMAGVLRKMGFKAYVLHTRTSSMVTVGEFDSDTDPHIKDVHQALTHNLVIKASDSRFESAVDLFSHPVPIQVPRP